MALASAAGVTYLMLSSALAAATVNSTPSSTQATAGVFGLPLQDTATPMTGVQLKQSPFVAQSATPLDGHPSDKILAAPPSNETINFTVGFNLRDQQALANLIQAQSTPGSPLFQHWLTNAQEMAMFGPDPTVVQNTINYYTSQGFKVETRGPISVGFSGTISSANAAFRTSLSIVQDSQPAPEILNTEGLSVPAPLAGSIASVNGFEGLQVKPALMYDTMDAQDMAASVDPGAVLPSAETVNTNETEAYNYSNHAFFWFNYFSHFYKEYRFDQVITPASLNFMYDASPLLAQGYNGNSTPGHQITIAIVMAGGINPGDMKLYGRMLWNNPNAILDRLNPVPVDHQSGLNGTTTWTDGGSGEMALDIEYSATMAPGAKIEPVYGSFLTDNDLDDDYATIAGMATLPNIISNSYGGSEDGGSPSAPSWESDNVLDNYFMLLTARGATILASSADGGGFDPSSGILSGSWPATDPYVLSIDGVRTNAEDVNGQAFPSPSTIGLANMTVSPNLPPNYPIHVSSAAGTKENSYWYTPITNTTLYQAAPYASGGFGESYFYNQSWIEHGLSVPDVGRSLGSGVAAEADFNQSIMFDGAFQVGWGGTSFACPTTAGMWADIDDYLQAHGHSAYQGNGNLAVYWVGNAWQNGNLTLDPFFDVTNGTSYWGNHGVQEGWQWPPGQVFPTTPRGGIGYGNTTVGWDFPTGWGVTNVENFAVDLNQLESLPGQVATTNAAGTAFNSGAWANLATNQTYYFHVNASASLLASGPRVTIEYFPITGTQKPVPGTSTNYTPALSPQTIGAAAGFGFSLDTGNPLGIHQSGLVIFIVSNATDKFAGFEYDWISNALPTVGSLQVQIVTPPGNAASAGSSTFSDQILGFWGAPSVVLPTGTNGNNLVLVQVTFNGKGVYNARVTGEVKSPYDLVFEGSRALNESQSFGQAHTQLSNTISQSFTNVTGYAYVQTWNVIQPTNLLINATYSTAFAQTNYTMTPPPNINLEDNYGGKMSYFNSINYTLLIYRQAQTPSEENIWAPNSVNQDGYYNTYYSWAGEQLKVNVNDYQGHPESGIKVWFGNWDNGRQTKFNYYWGSGGLVGDTNDTASVGITDSSGAAYINIPQNESVNASNPYFGVPIGTFDGNAAIAGIGAYLPGVQNITVNSTQDCLPTSSLVLAVLTCTHNNSVQRNYTSSEAIVLPDPVNAWTETPAGIHRDFFPAGSNLSFGLTVALPNNDPFINYYNYNWNPQEMHITNVSAYIDGVLSGSAQPEPNNDLQQYAAFANLTAGKLANGTHDLEVVVDASSGQVFTYTHKFVVGGITFDDLSIQDTYTQIPYNLNWTLNLPPNEVNNHTFSQTLEIQYVTGGCSGTLNPCPIVVNLTEKIHRGVTYYNQSINNTMLNLKHFYSGAGTLPSGQYLVTLWLNANKSGNVSTSLPTYFVFADLNGTFNGPSNNEVVPLGNVTISYSYTGGYLANATLFIFSQQSPAAPVFTTGIFVPAVGSNPRGGSVSWFATVPGAYRLVMDLGTPYTHVNITEWINVSLFGNIVWLNSTHAASSAIGGMSAASIGTALAIAAAIIGFLVGLIAAPAMRGAPPAGGAGPKPSKPWEDATGSAPSSDMPECSVCHEHFATPYALHAHQKSAHGIEE